MAYKSIEKKKILFVEGQDEIYFFESLLEKKGIDDVQIIYTGGKEKFAIELPAKKNLPGFDDVTSLAVIHDADMDVQSTFQSICSTLRNNDLKCPQKLSSFVSSSPRVGVFVIPDGKSRGKLESLCLSTVKSKGIINCVDSFIECVTQESRSSGSSYKKPKDFDKARCRAFLAAMERDTPALGIAAKRGYWDFNSKKLDPLLDFLKQL